ncbi:Gfo/Idh/MocA family protein [Halopiger djelfimassiliensis]|uniref:Gfo/Idh/MocA family protein n=1 Tax=Halopiger djelfimassiliensis TaxID=1293047 RepID=UPI0006782BD7|nr:Gfo/Idh/MocA family oxidoreductase [Halopiger djelfimassiliensis]
MTRNRERIDVGVIGVGSMGHHHARVYSELPEATLVGVADTDADRATAVASEYGTAAMDRESLLDAVDAVSVVVPTQYHYEVATACLDADVATFVEKPVLGSLERADEFRSRIEAADVPFQVGHIERFNPAVVELETILEECAIASVRARRLGPPVDREVGNSVVRDLMIHDIDIVLSLLRDDPVSVAAAGVDGNGHAAALLEFDGGTMASLTASRKTQRKVRTLEITAEECFIELDYLGQSIEIHRNSVPEYIETDGDVRFKHERLIERPAVPGGEPLRMELESFLETVATEKPPAVPVDEALAALSVAMAIERETERATMPDGLEFDR